MDLTLDALRDAVAGGTAGVRARFELEPLGGPGDKIAPPTYSADGAPTKYAEEIRRIDGVDVRCVSLNSVAAQANTMEEVLLEAARAGQLELPLVSVDFRDAGRGWPSWTGSARFRLRTASSMRSCVTVCSTTNCSG